jgi:hypothetical protein
MVEQLTSQDIIELFSLTPLEQIGMYTMALTHTMGVIDHRSEEEETSPTYLPSEMVHEHYQRVTQKFFAALRSVPGFDQVTALAIFPLLTNEIDERNDHITAFGTLDPADRISQMLGETIPAEVVTEGTQAFDRKIVELEYKFPLSQAVKTLDEFEAELV